MKAGISYVVSTLLLAICIVTIQPGCNSGPNLRDVYSTNIKKLHQCYMMYLEENDFMGPKDEAEFKKYLKNDATAIYLMKKIDLTPESVDEIFISDRDNKPYVVRYGLKGQADHAIIFEETGIEGMRMIALSSPIEVDSQTYDDYMSGKIKPETVTGAGAETFDEEATFDESQSVKEE